MISGFPQKQKKINHRDTEEGEVAQRINFLFCESKKERLRPRNAAVIFPFCPRKKGTLPLCYLFSLCASVVNFFPPEKWESSQ